MLFSWGEEVRQRSRCMCLGRVALLSAGSDHARNAPAGAATSYGRAAIHPRAIEEVMVLEPEGGRLVV